MPFNRDDLAVLMYAGNSVCLKVVPADDPQVAKAETVIDEKAGTWTAPRAHDPRYLDTFEIGNGVRHCEWGSHWGVIAVYDRTNFAHLSSLSNTSRHATKAPSYSQD